MKESRQPYKQIFLHKGGHCWPSPDGAYAAVAVWRDKAAIGREVARSNGPLMGSRGALTQQGPRDRLPLLLQRCGRERAAGAPIPAAGIRQIAFDAVQVGVRPGAFRVGLLLRALMSQMPIALGFPPQRLRRHAEVLGRGVVGKRAFVSLEIHRFSSSSERLSGIYNRSGEQAIEVVA